MASLFLFEDLTTEKKTKIAEYVSDFTNSQEGNDSKIKPISFQTVMEDIYGATVAFEDSRFAGYVSPGEVWQGEELDYQQIGSLVVPLAFRGKGIATELVNSARDEVIQDWNIPFAFCSANSQPVFSKSGFEPALPGELPDGVKSKFNNVPMIYPMYKFIELESWGHTET